MQEKSHHTICKYRVCTKLFSKFCFISVELISLQKLLLKLIAQIILFCYFQTGTLMTRKFENAMKLDWKSWGYRRDTTLKEVISIEKLLQDIAETIRLDYG